MTGEEAWEFVKKHASQLGEHFDSVQIFCSKYEGSEGTASVNCGEGNWFARYGHVKQWLIKEEEYARCQSRKDSD